jgi:hypothetical protein
MNAGNDSLAPADLEDAPDLADRALVPVRREDDIVLKQDHAWSIGAAGEEIANGEAGRVGDTEGGSAH